MKLVATISILCLLAAACLGYPVYPIKVSSTNSRILVDQNNNPFLMVSDSAWCLLSSISQTDAAGYINDRNTNGFNTLLIAVLTDTYISGPANGELYNGTLPFTNRLRSGYYNITNANSAYFSYVDTVVNMCASNGIEVIFYPIETGGWLNTMLANGTNACYLYGQYIGNRYKNFPNIIWANGNDYQWNTTDDPYVEAVARGILSKDTNHIQTVEIEPYPGVSLDDPAWAPIVNLNWAYTYDATYSEMLHAYQTYTNIPLVMGESFYEWSPFYEGGNGPEPTVDNVIRRQEWWDALSGESGQIYGNNYTFQFASGWQSHLDSVGVTQLEYVDNLLTSNEWYNLVPDIQNTFVTAGYGTYNSSDSIITNSNYALGAYTPDGALGIVYIPGRTTITVAMSLFTNTVVAQWYDPGNGSYSAVSGSPFSNTGSKTFTPARTNSIGDTDWVLLLKAPVAPKIASVSMNGNDFVVSVPTILGQNYELFGTTNLEGGAWVPAGTASGTGGIVEIGATPIASQSQQFYRVQAGF
jgi:hypothetical protein